MLLHLVTYIIQVTYFHFIVHVTTRYMRNRRYRDQETLNIFHKGCMPVWQLDLSELSHFQSMLLTAWFMSTQAKHHKPSNRSSCLSFSAHVIVTTLVGMLYSVCVHCALRLDQQKLNMAHQLPMFLTNTLCCIMCQISVNKCAHVQINNLAVCMLNGGRQRKSIKPGPPKRPRLSLSLSKDRFN